MSERTRPWLKTVWQVNVGLVVALVICMVTVDMNGEYPLLGRWGSLLLTVALFGTGIALSAYLTVVDQKRRLFAGLCLVLFVLAALPAVL